MATQERLLDTARVWVDALTYAVGVTLGVTLIALVVGIASGGGFVRAKILLFVAGWILLSYATVRLWPRSPEDVSETRDPLPEAADSTRFQAFVQALPPLRWMRPPPPGDRLQPPLKLFLGSLLILFGSFLMETAFGV